MLKDVSIHRPMWMGFDEFIIIIIIYLLKIGAGQQGRIPGTYNCPQYKIKCRNIKYKRITENTFTITT